MPKRLTPSGQAAPPVKPIQTGATFPAKEEPKARKPVRRSQKNEREVGYVRNLHHIETRVTLTTGREIHLKPRGQREDVDVVNAEEQQDPRYLSNINLIFELITPAQAEEVISKQQTNTRQEDHPLWAYLRNEKGQPYEQRAHRIEEVFEKQGIVVGEVKETGAGRFTDKNSEVTRREAGPTIVEAPGSPGHSATAFMQSVPGDVSPEDYHDFLLWKQFKAQAEADQIRESLKVTVEPVKTDEDA